MATMRRDLNKVKVEPIARGDTYIFSKPGQILRGVYIGARKTKYEGREVMIHRLENGNGGKVEVWESRALSNLSLIKPGKVVEIKYLGKRKSKKSNRKYNDFQISVEPGGLKKSPNTPF